MAMWPGATGGVGGGWPGITLIRGEGRARLSGVGAAKNRARGFVSCTRSNILYY